MKVFLSWSGAKSLRAAKLTYEWLPTVMQSCEVFLSDDDIRKGDRWAIEVASELEDVNFGLFFVTKANYSAPWLLFEAGAISKSVERGKVVPILLDLSKDGFPSSPLTQFQMSDFERSEFLKIINYINLSSDRPVPQVVLNRTFNGLWERYHDDMQQIIESEEFLENKEFSMQDEIRQIRYYFQEFREFLDSDSVVRKSDFLELHKALYADGDRGRFESIKMLANEINALTYSAMENKLAFEAEASLANRLALNDLTLLLRLQASSERLFRLAGSDV